jgi:hypothetical protein
VFTSSAPSPSSSGSMPITLSSSPSSSSSRSAYSSYGADAVPSPSSGPSTSDDDAAAASLDWKLLHSLGMMCATVYKSGKAIREVYGKHALIHKSTPPLRVFVVHNEVCRPAFCVRVRACRCLDHAHTTPVCNVCVTISRRRHSG